MKHIIWWLQIFGTVAVAALADSVSTLWAKGEDKFSIYLFYIFFLGPLVFISFGLVTAKVGLAITSGLVNSLLVVTSILIGLFLFNEWNKISIIQYIGLVSALIGIVLMLFFPKADS